MNAPCDKFRENDDDNLLDYCLCGWHKTAHARPQALERLKAWKCGGRERRVVFRWWENGHVDVELWDYTTAPYLRYVNSNDDLEAAINAALDKAESEETGQ